jgi:hypothetical protein
MEAELFIRIGAREAPPGAMFLSIFRAIVGSLALAIFSGCGESDYQVLRRVSSPAGELEAVLIRWPTNATSGSSFGLFIVEKDQTLDPRHPSVAGSGLMAETLAWSGAHTVRISYRARSHVTRLFNLWESSRNPTEPVEVVLDRVGGG